MEARASDATVDDAASSSVPGVEVNQPRDLSRLTPYATKEALPLSPKVFGSGLPIHAQKAPETPGVSWHVGVQGWESSVEIQGQRTTKGYAIPEDADDPDEVEHTWGLASQCTEAEELGQRQTRVTS